MRRSARRVWFLMVPRTGLLNLAGPWDVLGHANEVLGRIAYELELVGSDDRSVQTRHGLVIGGLRPLPQRGGPPLPDVAIVPGGSALEPLADRGAGVVPWLRRHHERIPTLIAVCTGAFVLGAAGVLDGRRATTHPAHVGDLRARFPAAQVVDEGIFVRDGAVWTSAGIMPAIDLTLALVEEHHGQGVAMAVAKRLMLFVRRSGSEPLLSPALLRQEAEPPTLFNISRYVLEHLDEPLSVERIAAGVGMSARTLTRKCREHLDQSPAQLIRRIRLDEARRLLEETALPLKDISERAGLGDASTMWRAFTRRLGITPAKYRQRFSPVLSRAVDRAAASPREHAASTASWTEAPREWLPG
jgi:transcriptional regulator GlxA family with amidase domain